MTFHITLAPPEHAWIVAECPALPGCISQGRNEEEAIPNIRGAITAWMWAEDQKPLNLCPKIKHRFSLPYSRILPSVSKSTSTSQFPLHFALYPQMGRLSNIPSKEAARAFRKVEWHPVGQVGSHLVFDQAGPPRQPFRSPA